MSFRQYGPGRAVYEQVYRPRIPLPQEAYLCVAKDTFATGLTVPELPYIFITAGKGIRALSVALAI